tara:strand:+ start:31 stop:231 length:201 start_codon:yes stop_codon:yes gene_type:complete
MSKNNCSNCSHFYVTYQTKFPYGCRAFGVISKKTPYLEIRKVSGTNCALFSKKKINAKISNKGRIA